MFIKKGISFMTDHAIVEVIPDGQQCSACGESLNLMESKQGEIECQFCKHKNSVGAEKSNG